MSNKLTQDDKELLFCSSMPAGLTKKDMPVISVDNVKIMLHNLRFEQAEIERQLLESNAKHAQIKLSAKWLDKHVEFDMESNGSIHNEAAYEKLMFEIDEASTNSVTLHDAECSGDYCQRCGTQYGTIYRVPNDVWTKIAPSPETLGDYIEHQFGGLLCISCADSRASEVGIVLRWDSNAGDWLVNDQIKLVKAIPDYPQFDLFIRAFWRRIEMYKNDYEKELPDDMPSIFKTSMTTAFILLRDGIKEGDK